ncbi:60S acidic ribosomal protein P0-like [Asparagus officinalis]|uniref:60S acidic ribosomal protein P0-like n=1 Tax=Asparagus officinalis TaxID=4686 RepID=UPI00098E0756|nr:60S acidic ribosomal protein P0-like [Asparagus officinalis]
MCGRVEFPTDSLSPHATTGRSGDVLSSVSARQAIGPLPRSNSRDRRMVSPEIILISDDEGEEDPIAAIMSDQESVLPISESVQGILQKLEKVLNLTEDDLVDKVVAGVSMVASLSLALYYPILAAAREVFINTFKNLLTGVVDTEYIYI